MEIVSIVTIKEKIPLFKGEEQATSIELITLEEIGFELVAAKNLYQVGDKAIYIQPDYNLSDIPLFESFIRPNGDESKSMLGRVDGKPRRIRAKKFTLHRGDNEVVYSNGILLPYEKVMDWCGEIYFNTGLTLTNILNITKYEEPENVDKGGVKVMGSKPFPEGIYKTDETNIHNVWNHLNFPIELVGTEKIDGSSITIGIKNGEGFICSRNMLKPFTYMKVIGVRKTTLWEKIKILFNTSYYPDLRIREKVSNDQDDFIKYGKPYLDVLTSMGYGNIILRGELHGEHLRGSGNKNNPAKSVKPNIKFFGLDIISNGFAIKQDHQLLIDTLNTLNKKTEQIIAFIPCEEVFNKTFKTRETLIKECEKYFKKNMIEGIVIRTPDSKFSAKYMNLEYDSKK